MHFANKNKINCIKFRCNPKICNIFLCINFRLSTLKDDSAISGVRKRKTYCTYLFILIRGGKNCIHVHCKLMQSYLVALFRIEIEFVVCLPWPIKIASLSATCKLITLFFSYVSDKTAHWHA